MSFASNNSRIIILHQYNTVLFFLAWPIAGVCAAIWIFLQVRLCWCIPYSIYIIVQYYNTYFLIFHSFYSHLKDVFALSRISPISLRNSSRGLVMWVGLLATAQLVAQVLSNNDITKKQKTQQSDYIYKLNNGMDWFCGD